MSEDHGHLSHAEVSAFIDGELAQSEVSSLERHLAGCHACALNIVSAMQLKAATAQALARVTVPPEALSRLTAQLRPQTQRKPERIDPVRAWTWGALAACLIVAISLLAWRGVHPPDELAAELLDQHLAVLSDGSSPEVVSSDRHTVKPWFQGRLPFSFNLPTVLPPGTVLDGADLAYLQGQPAALLLFHVGKHRASVFLTQRSVGDHAPVSPWVRSGFTIQSSNTYALRIVAVSDVNPPDLALLVSALVQAQSPR